MITGVKTLSFTMPLLQTGSHDGISARSPGTCTSSIMTILLHEEDDWLGKVRPLIDHLSSEFETLYEPSKNVAVDETMIKFQGRSSLKQYMPKKPIKCGIKVWVLGDGYFSRFDIYSGRKEDREVGLGAHVVKKLTENLKDKYHHVFFDNYFTSFRLLEDLEDGIYGCGTARKDRKEFPAVLKNPGLKIR